MSARMISVMDGDKMAAVMEERCNISISNIRKYLS